jgi:hypothetical protein
MNNLAATYGALGRHEDALAMEESVLEFRRRVLPPNHPQITGWKHLFVCFGLRHAGKDDVYLINY